MTLSELRVRTKKKKSPCSGFKRAPCVSSGEDSARLCAWIPLTPCRCCLTDPVYWGVRRGKEFLSQNERQIFPCAAVWKSWRPDLIKSGSVRSVQSCSHSTGEWVQITERVFSLSSMTVSWRKSINHWQILKEGWFPFLATGNISCSHFCHLKPGKIKSLICFTQASTMYPSSKKKQVFPALAFFTEGVLPCF